MNTYEVGELVEYEGEIGIVGWSENRHMGLKRDDGFIGIELLTGTRAFVSPVKVDCVEKSSIKALADHYQNELSKIEKRFEECWFNRLEKLEIQNKFLVELIKTCLVDENDKAKQQLDNAIEMIEHGIECTNEKIKKRFLETALDYINDAKNRLYRN